MRNNNFNKWTQPMQVRMMELVETLDLSTDTNRYGEPKMSLMKDNQVGIGIIAQMLNSEFGSTLTVSSVANRYHWYKSSDAQREAIRARRNESKKKSRDASKPEVVVEVVKSPEPPKSNVGVADVIIKCARLVRENKMTTQELYRLIDEL